MLPGFKLALQPLVRFEGCFFNSLLLDERAGKLDVVVGYNGHGNVNGLLLLRGHVAAESYNEILQVVFDRLKKSLKKFVICSAFKCFYKYTLFKSDCFNMFSSGVRRTKVLDTSC